MIQTGERIPEVTLKRLGDDGIEDVPTADFFKGRKVALFGVPGAYTPTCSQKHLPGFIEHAEQFKAKGVDEVACVSVNDPFVMKEWARASGAEGKVTLLADGNAELAQAMGLDFDGSGAGLGTRCKRFSAVVDDGVVTSLHVEESPGAVNVSGAETLLREI